MKNLNTKFKFEPQFRRSPSEVMTLEKMGSCFPTRLSFMRILLRKLIENKSQIKTHLWSINKEGYGHAVYTINVDQKIIL